MSYAFKAKLLGRQGKSPEEILKVIVDEADRKIADMDRRLARFVEEATPEQIKWLNEDLGIEAPAEGEDSHSPKPS